MKNSLVDCASVAGYSAAVRPHIARGRIEASARTASLSDAAQIVACQSLGQRC